MKEEGGRRRKDAHGNKKRQRTNTKLLGAWHKTEAQRCMKRCSPKSNTMCGWARPQGLAPGRPTPPGSSA